MRKEALKIHFSLPKCCVLSDMVLKKCVPFVWQGKVASAVVIWFSTA